MYTIKKKNLLGITAIELSKEITNSLCLETFQTEEDKTLKSMLITTK